MKKIIAALDGLRLSESTMQHALSLSKQTNAHLVGVFLDDMLYHSYHFEELIDEEGGISDKKMHQLNEKDQQKRNTSVQLFEQACQQAGLNYSIHRDKNVALQDLLHESIYADLLVINSAETFTHYEEEAPTRFIRDLLTDVQCPVLIVPAKYHPIEKLILLYDGEPSSVYAIKMFSYLLPTLTQLETEVLSIKNPKQSTHIPDTKLVKEYLKRHFEKVEYVVLKGIPEEQITGYLQNQNPNSLVVLGAYQRGRVSRWFRESMADHLMIHLHRPLFIAHNK